MLTNVKDYNKAMKRYEQVKYSAKGSEMHTEKMLLVDLIGKYERSKWDFPELEADELMKIRVEEFGYVALKK